MTSEKTIIFEIWNKKLMVPLLELFLFSTIKLKASYGFELVELAQERLDENIKIPTVYSLLKRSTQNGFLTNEEIIEQFDKSNLKKTRGIARRYYNITNEGINHLHHLRYRMKQVCHLFLEEQV